MISADFAPNERIDDALLSASLLLMPWRWKRGEVIKKVKKQLSDLFANDNVYLFLTGRGALYNLLSQLNLAKGSEVVVQAFTCEAVVLPIIANQLKPVYVDIETETLSLDLYDLEKKLSSKTKVLILQHTFGLIPKYRSQIVSLATRHNVIIIEDLAHGFDLSLFKNRQTKTIKLLSFGRSKALSSVFGAALITNNDLIADKLSHLEKSLAYPDNLFIFKLLLYKPFSLIIKSTYDFGLGKLIHQLIKILNLLVPEISAKEKAAAFDPLMNKAYPNALAILLAQQLKKFDLFYHLRAQISRFYQENLPKNLLLNPSHYLKGSFLRFPLLVNDRHEILNGARQHNIFLGKWYDQVVAPKALNLKKVGYQIGSCPKAEKICQKIINLPTNIGQKQAKIVTETLKTIIKNIVN
ncbi:MAG: aminotransferase class I/II-fold pyridoxal phosphate-dependent enzyme [Microgenomates group bacterium]|nr:aminotransferase class I/II-fold pyridoxal phosphate-dependent enzyme [Microgenomates group bacterium]